MKRVEKVFLIILIVSLIYKYLYGVGSSLLLLLSINLLAVFYLYFSFALLNDIEFRKIFKKASYPKNVRKRLAISIFTGIAISTSLMGILFKIQDYPGADLLLLASLGFTMALSLITLYKNYKVDGDFYFNVFIRVGITALIIISMFKIPEKALLEWQYPDSPEYIKAVIDVRNNPKNDSLQEIKRLEFEKMKNRIENKKH